MTVKYDLHVHTGLSPCAHREMAPAKILEEAQRKGLQLISITDHNAINNVKITIDLAKNFDISILPGVEITSSEDIHLLCFFPTYENLKDFFQLLPYPNRKFFASLFGNQYIYNEHNKIVGKVDRILHTRCKFSEEKIFVMAKDYQGVCVPAHIDREHNSFLSILGFVPDYYPSIEISYSADMNKYKSYEEKFNVLRNSDAHRLRNIGRMQSSMDIDIIDMELIVKKLSMYK